VLVEAQQGPAVELQAQAAQQQQAQWLAPAEAEAAALLAPLEQAVQPWPSQVPALPRAVE
jgi:hypothetical protein